MLQAWVDCAQNPTVQAFAPLKKWKIKKNLFPDLQKTFFDSQSLLTAFRIFLQVIKVIKLHDKTNSEMVVNRSLVRLHRLSPYPLLIYCLFGSLAQPEFCFSRRLRLSHTTSKRFSLFSASRRYLSIPVDPMSWSQPNSDLLLVIQLLHPGGLHSPGLQVGGTREDGCECGSLRRETETSQQYHAHFPP